MPDQNADRLSSGIDGIDELLGGGFLPHRTYMIRGRSGTGKTIFGYHFLSGGVGDGGDGLYVAFEETAADIRANAASLGFDLGDVRILDMSPSQELFLEDETYSIFSPSEVEGKPFAEEVRDAVETHEPARVFIDPLTQLRHLSPDEYQFNRTAASLMSYLKARDATTLFTSQPTTERSDDDLQYLCDGAITLSRSEHGRTVEVEKFRGSDFRGGSHAFSITSEDGLTVFPKILPGTLDRTFTHEQRSSGFPELDELLGGGIESGSVTLIGGPSGVGKSTTGTAFARETARRGKTAVLYLFEESRVSFEHRTEAIGIPVREMVEEGTLLIREIEPLALSADEFAHHVRGDLEEHDLELVMIDGTSGYRISLQDDEQDLRMELHALCRYLRNEGVTVVVTDETSEVTGTFRASDSHISYLADNIVFIRYIEVGGEIRKAIGVLKKRFSGFEPALRAFRIGSDGIEIGTQLDDLRGVLTGTPSDS